MTGSAFDSLQAFLAMGGYGGYVWGSIGMCALALGLEVAWLRHARRALRAAGAQEASLARSADGLANGQAAPAPARVNRPVVTRAPQGVPLPEGRP